MNRVMVVDDEAIITMQLGMRLRTMGYDVVGTASSAEESVRMAKDLNPNLILMDIVMSGNLDGIHAAEIIKDEMDIPIIFLTAYTDDEYIKRAKNVSPFGYIVKPYSDNEVKANIEIAIHKKELERKQKQAGERIRRLFLSVEQSPCMIMIMDTKGNIEFINNKFSRMTGYESREILGKNISLLKSDEMSPEVYKEMWDKITAGEEWRGELCIRRKSGEPYQECAIILPVKNANGDIDFSIVVMDSVIEHKKRKQMLILQSEKLDAMRVMTAEIAHEFNNVFAVISGNAQLLKEGYKGDEEFKDEFNGINKAIDRGAKIIREMKEFTNVKIDTAEYFHFNIGKLIKQALDSTMHIWKDKAKARGISYDIDGEDIKELPAVFGNPSEIKEVLVNIINNALNAMPDGGRLSFSTWSREGAVFVSISDTGKGMTNDVKNRIFDPFFTTRSPEGTGLGMSTAYSMIIRNGGRISVESEPGKGTTVIVRFGIVKEIDNLQAEKEIKQSRMEKEMDMDVIINVLALTVEKRDSHKPDHQKRVSLLASAIADEIGLPNDLIKGIRMAGTVHDIGKVHIPTEILIKPGKLTKDEFYIVKSHPQVGYDILKGIGISWPVAEIVHQHHEDMDGSGYPLGLSNGDIMLEARILRVADTVEAMVSHRSYRPAFEMDRALEEISKNKNVRYDSNVVDTCLKVIKEKMFQF